MVASSVDPNPEVARLARTVLAFVRSKAQNVAQPKELHDAKSSSSFSAPSSPSSKTSFIGGESPPANMSTSQEMQRSVNAPGRPITIYHHVPRTRKLYDKSPSTILEEASEDNTAKSPLIATDFVDWCCKYLAQPVMKYIEDMDPESELYNQFEWRYLHNARLRKEAESEQKRAAGTRMDNQVFINRNPSMPSVLRFHPFEYHIAVADKDYCSIWEWEQGLRLSHFSNANSHLTRITSVDFLNGHNHSLLLVGTDDGAAKVWRNYAGDEGQEPELVTAWQALTDMLPSNRGAGLVLEWEQESCLLFASGDVRVIRMWDCERELKVKDIPTGADSCITSMSLDVNMFIGGFGDGTVRLYDRRCTNNDCRIATMREHAGWVVNVHLCKHGDYAGKIISGSVSGDVKFWDSRMTTSSLKTFICSQAMTALTIHPAADIFACGSANQFISPCTFAGESLGVIKYHDGFMGQRIGPVSCLDFHPYKVNLAAGSTDSFISVYAAERRS